jgi:hypothetical protein
MRHGEHHGRDARVIPWSTIDLHVDGPEPFSDYLFADGAPALQTMHEQEHWWRPTGGLERQDVIQPVNRAAPELAVEAEATYGIVAGRRVRRGLVDLQDTRCARPPFGDRPQRCAEKLSTNALRAYVPAHCHVFKKPERLSRGEERNCEATYTAILRTHQDSVALVRDELRDFVGWLSLGRINGVVMASIC